MQALVDLVIRYNLVIDKQKSVGDAVVIRSTISSKEQASQFVQKFSFLTNTDWIVNYAQSQPQRVVFHKAWHCHRNRRNKLKGSTRNAFCTAALNILVKKVNRGTIKNDSFLKHKPPLPCVIRMNIRHSHNVRDDGDLQLLSVTDEVRDKFFNYFGSGLSFSQARTINEIHLKLKKNKDLLKSTKFNPSLRQARYMYNCWLDRNKPASTAFEETVDNWTTVSMKEFLDSIPKEEPPPRTERLNLCDPPKPLASSKETVCFMVKSPNKEERGTDNSHLSEFGHCSDTTTPFIIKLSSSVVNQASEESSLSGIEPENCDITDGDSDMSSNASFHFTQDTDSDGVQNSETMSDDDSIVWNPQNMEDSNCVLKPTKITSNEVLKKQPGSTEDDYLFFMSLLPEMKGIPQDEKTTLKSKIRTLVMTARLASSK